MQDQQGTNTNTILIVIAIIILLVLGFLWYNNTHKVVAPAEPNNGGSLNINLTGNSATTTQ